LPKVAIVRKLVCVRLSSRSLSIHRCSLHQIFGEMAEKEPITNHW
jgi:hypothetical protein